MYKYTKQKAQEFVDIFCVEFQLPYLEVRILDSHPEHRPAGIQIGESRITIWKKEIPNRKAFIIVLLHELSHWLLYWLCDGTQYKKEKNLVIPLTYYLAKLKYPGYSYV
jgi:hypothetical protein